MLNRKSDFEVFKNKFLVFFFFALLLLVSPIMRGTVTNGIVTSLQTTSLDDSLTIDAQPFPDSKPLRIAIYDESNLTSPTYDQSGSDNNNNVSYLVDILSANPFIDITILNAVDISNRILTTANFDVFAIIDNNPREFIVDMVLDFWIAGGGLLVFDGGYSFLGYTGILPPEASGNDGHPAYWAFYTDGYNITTRHPVSKAYAEDTHIDANGVYNYGAWDWTALSSSVVAGDLTPIAHSDSDADEITILAFDPSDRGGKVVTIGYDLSFEEIPQLNQLIRDSVDWLTPRPKARIVFDLSHEPYYTVDTWDDVEANFYGEYITARNKLVSLGYTVDKLYPAVSGDNFTLDRLEPYDVLITGLPNIAYTAGDLAAIEAWVNGGGAILVTGENPNSLATQVGYVNSLLTPFDMQINNGDLSATTYTDFDIHPTTELCTGIHYISHGFIDVSGDAFTIWYDTVPTDTLIAGVEFGNGRVITTTDINWLDDSYIGNDDNEQYLINSINWLSAARANVLVYTSWFSSVNFYKTPVTLALNDLGAKYYLVTGDSTQNYDYLNLSLNIQDWDLVIVDNPNWFTLDPYYGEFIEYVNSGGHFIMSYFDIDAVPTHPLWSFLGCQYNSTFTNEPPVFIWDAGHPVFTQPHNYGADNFTYGTAYTDDGDTVGVFPNATSLAGLSATPEVNQSIIVLRNDEQTLFNSYLIDYFTDDLDDSTYADNYELWKNEIAFMMRPKLNFDILVPNESTVGTEFTITAEITNFGITAAPIGYLDLSLPAGLITADNLEQQYAIPSGGLETVSWTINSTAANNYTIVFEGTYTGFIGTEYFTGPLPFDITITEPPTTSPSPFSLDWPWWYYVAAGGGLLLLIVIIVVIVAVTKKKKVPTR